MYFLCKDAIVLPKNQLNKTMDAKAICDSEKDYNKSLVLSFDGDLTTKARNDNVFKIDGQWREIDKQDHTVKHEIPNISPKFHTRIGLSSDRACRLYDKPLIFYSDLLLTEEHAEIYDVAESFYDPAMEPMSKDQ